MQLHLLTPPVDYSRVLVVVLFSTLFTLPTRGVAQCLAEVGSNSFNCDTLNATMILSSSAFCAQSTDTFFMHSDIPADQVTVCFGDGTPDYVGNNPGTDFIVPHTYNLNDLDSCPIRSLSHPYIGIFAVATFIKGCGGGNKSAEYPIKNLTFYFKPRVRFPYPAITLCQGGCYLIPIDTLSCTNSNNGGFTNYAWNYGDGSAPDTTLNSPDDATNFQIPCHNYAASNNDYVFTIDAWNKCGAENASIDVYSQHIDSISISGSGRHCTGDVVTFNIAAENGGLPNTAFTTTVAPMTGVIIQNASSSHPAITFDSVGTYNIVVSYGGCSIDSQVSIQPGVNINYFDSIPTMCLLNNPTLVLSNHYSSYGNAQTNDFSVTDSAGNVIFQNTSSGIPATPISLAETGQYVITDTSTTTCNTEIFRNSFVVLPPITPVLPPDTALCLQSFYTLPDISGTTISLDSIPVSSGSFYIDSVRVYAFTYTPQCGNAAVLHITGKGVKAFATDETVCFPGGTLTLSGTPTGGVFNGSFVLGDQFDGTSAGQGQHSYTGILYGFLDIISNAVSLFKNGFKESVKENKAKSDLRLPQITEESSIILFEKYSTRLQDYISTEKWPGFIALCDKYCKIQIRKDIGEFIAIKKVGIDSYRWQGFNGKPVESLAFFITSLILHNYLNRQGVNYRFAKVFLKYFGLEDEYKPKWLSTLNPVKA